ncbi:hypothetical protein R3P38DRAFT_1398073 [Favolaschia claudopus]|uniref:Uncharacterized protein n=1 Tax=Favolaschia claudopus TaxID=2862362 RepID=A0AAW0ASY3_9AGAR
MDDDERIADSEGEEEYLPLAPPPRLPASAVPTDVISSFPVNPVASAQDSISSPSTVTPSARPRPKPVWKGAPGAAPRPNPGDSSVIESYSGTNASERLKIRSGGASRPPIQSSSEVIELSDSDDDELAFPKNQVPKASTSSALPSSNRLPSPRQPVLKRPPLPPAYPLASSPLPPSDPFSIPSSTALYQQNSRDEELPPIVTLPGATETGSDSALSQRISNPPLKIKIKVGKPSSSSPAGNGEIDGQRSDGAAPDPSVPSTGPAALTSDILSSKAPKKSRKKQDGEKPAPKPRAKKPKGDLEGGAEGGQDKPKKKRKGKEKETVEFKSAEFVHDEDDEPGLPIEKVQPPPKPKKGKGKEKEQSVFKSAEFIHDEDEDDPIPPIPPASPSLHSPPASGGPARIPSIQKPASIVSIPDSQPDEELLPLVNAKRKRVGDADEDANHSEDLGEVPLQKKSKKAKTATQSREKSKKKGEAKRAKGKTTVPSNPDDVSDNEAKEAPKLSKGPAKKNGRTVISDDEGSGGEADAQGPSTVSPRKNVVLTSQTEDNEEEEIIKLPQTKKPTKKRAIQSDSEGEEVASDVVKPVKKQRRTLAALDSKEDEPSRKENDENSPPRTSSGPQVENIVHGKPSSTLHKKNVESTPKPTLTSVEAKYRIGSRTKSTPMSELIRRVNSKAGSPFPVIGPRRSSLGGTAGAATESNPGTPTTSYSPFHKFSRTTISRMAPLHPNRRTPPPPPPPPPPKPKTKKQKEQEERWEEEMIEAHGGWDDWKLLTEQEQKTARRAKWDRELGGWED